MTRPICVGRESVKSLFPIYTFSSWLGVFPTFDLKQKQLVVSPLKIFCVSIMVISLIGVEVFGIICSIQATAAFQRNRLKAFLYIINDISTISWITGAFLHVSLGFERDIWQAFFLNLQKVEANKLMLTKPDLPRLWRRPVPQFGLFNLLTIGGLAAVACLEPSDGPTLHCARIAKLILNYIEAVSVVLTANVILVICHKYDQINRNLRPDTLANTNALFRTRTIKQLYIIMDRVIEQFNQLSGKHILFISAVVTCRLLISLVSIAEALLETGNTSRDTYTSNLFLILVALFELTSVTYSSQITLAESQKLIPLCYDIQEKYFVCSDEYRALDNLIQLITYRKVRFSAASLFEVNMSTLFTLLSGAISYLVVVLQSKNTF